MGRLLSLTRDQAICGLALVALATVACLSPVHNDTWWHLAYGREMATRGGFAQFDFFSHTAFGRSFANHQWLAERVMYGIWRLGGLPLLTASCAALLVSAWVLCWRLTRGPVMDRLLVTGAAAAGSTLVWSIRPQVFTVVLLPLVVTALVHRRIRWLPVVVLVWANLHGGVLLGLLAMGVWTAVALVYERERFVSLAVTLLSSVAATLCTPLGLRYWPEVIASLRRSQVNALQEWRPPGWPPEHVFFWGAAVALIFLAIRRWGRLSSLADRGLVATAVLFLLPASRTLRNVSPFLMVAAPALTRLLFAEAASRNARRSAMASLAVVVAAIGAALIVVTAWATPWARLGWVPMEAADIVAVGGCSGPIFNTYADGGPITWFVPSQRVFIDSRQDQYPDGLVAEVTAVSNGRDPRSLFDRFGVRCAVLPAQSPLAATLSARGWERRYASKTWAVYELQPPRQ